MMTAKPLDKTKIKTACANCSLARLCIPFGLTDDELQQLDNMVQRKTTLQRGQFAFQAGEPFHSLHAVRSGTFKLLDIDRYGHETIINFALPGDLIGFDGVHAEHYQLSAQALETSAICTIEYDHLLDLAHKIPNLQSSLLNILSQKLTPQFQFNINHSAEQRLAKFLLGISARLERRGYSATQFNLSMSRQDIGHYLGLAPETISRLFKRFEQLKLLRVSRRNIDILNVRELQVLSCRETE